MPDVPRNADPDGEKPAESACVSNENKENPTQSTQSYYYDDAHGYEDFDPESAGDDDKESDQ